MTVDRDLRGYGTRAGYWRIMALLDRYDMPATTNCCARALTLSP